MICEDAERDGQGDMSASIYGSSSETKTDKESKKVLTVKGKDGRQFYKASNPKVKDDTATMVKDLAVKFFGGKPYSQARIGEEKNIRRYSFAIGSAKDLTPEKKKKLVKFRDKFVALCEKNGAPKGSVDVKFHTGNRDLYASIQVKLGSKQVDESKVDYNLYAREAMAIVGGESEDWESIAQDYAAAAGLNADKLYDAIMDIVEKKERLGESTDYSPYGSHSEFSRYDDVKADPKYPTCHDCGQELDAFGMCPSVSPRDAGRGLRTCGKGRTNISLWPMSEAKNSLTLTQKAALDKEFAYWKKAFRSEILAGETSVVRGDDGHSIVITHKDGRITSRSVDPRGKVELKHSFTPEKQKQLDDRASRRDQLVQEFRTILKGLKLPSGGDKTDLSWSWYKRGGHAGRNQILSFQKSAEVAGWKPLSTHDSNSPDGSHVNYGTSLQKGNFIATWNFHYGVVAYDNSFSINIKPKDPSIY